MTAYTSCGIKLEEEEGLFDCIAYNLSLISTIIISRVNDIICKLVSYCHGCKLVLYDQYIASITMNAGQQLHNYAYNNNNNYLYNNDSKHQ